MNELTRQTLCETGIVTSNAKDRAPPRSYVLKVMSGPSQGKQIAIGVRPVSVGADGASGLVLRDPKVSRRHFEVCALPEGLAVRDLESTNGTFVDGVRVSSAVSPNVSSIRCGGTTLRVSRAQGPTIAPSGRSRFGALVGESLLMRELFAVLELAAPTEATVLVQGESGTGKELVARAIHDHSPRANGPFVVLDCSATNEQLIESHLFGHARGAFTGAITERKGAFLEAHGGTLFLDELGELPLASQAKLLRALEDRHIQPLGSDRPVPVDTRVVAATHRDLGSMVAERAFRFDLFHRLSVVQILLPPLRHRFDDLACLILHFYEGRGVPPGPIDGANLETLMNHNWPGNVRELRNVLERSWVLSGGGRTLFRDLQMWIEGEAASPFEVVDTSLDFKQAKTRWVAAFERRYLAAIFAQYNKNLARAAAHADINRRHFRKLLIEHGLKAPVAEIEVEPEGEGEGAGEELRPSAS